jgi:MFS family permease
MLPLAGSAVAPSPGLAFLPSAALLAGAVAGPFPAALLSRRAGRPSALALGAGLGVLGGGALAWALLMGSFPVAVLGAFLLGTAQGIGALYRHAAAFDGSRAGALSVVFGAGLLAGLAGPSLAGWAEAAWSPHLFVGTALVATLAHLAALGASLAVPAPAPARVLPARLAPPWRSLAAPTLVGGAGWLAMTALMLSTPLAMAACGISLGGVSGAVAWHVAAMYAPAILAVPCLRRLGARGAAGWGLALIAAAAAGLALAETTAAFSGALAALGCGWGLVTLATGVWLHRDGAPSARQLAAHDAVLFGSALVGALLIAPLAA